MSIHTRTSTPLVQVSAALLAGFAATASADITITGPVSPPSVTSGLVSGDGVFISDETSSGSLTVDGGSSLLIDNVNGFGGIITFDNSGQLLVSNGQLEINARNGFQIGGGGQYTINNGSYVLINASDDRNPAVFNRGRAINIAFCDESGFVTIDGPGTQVDLIRRFNIKSTGNASCNGIGTGRVTLSNGATLTQDSSDSSLDTGFTVGAVGRGELILESGATLESLVPRMRLANSDSAGAIGIMDLSGGSLAELTTAAWIGSTAGTANLIVTDSAFRIFADPAIPVPETGDLYAGVFGNNATVDVQNGQFDVANNMYIALGNSASNADVDFQLGSTAVIGGDLGISHDGLVGTGHGTGHVKVCDSTLTASTILIGETGTLAGGGPSGVANITANVEVYGGAILPGCSPGELTVDGNVTFVDGELRIEVNSNDDLDVLTVLGDLDFTSGTVVFEFGNGYGPQAGDQLNFIQAATLTGTENLDYEFEGLVEGFAFDVNDSGPNVVFTALTDGAPEFVEPHIDIRPGFSNWVYPGSRFWIPVAILSTSDQPIFDAANVDPSTLAFGPNATTAFVWRSGLVDLDFDGDRDLLVWFNIRDSGIACGDESAELTGMTYAGTLFSASDSLITLGCK